MFCRVVSFGVVHYAIEGMRICLASLLMSWISIVIIGPAGLFMYKSVGFISKTSPILLAMIVRAFSFLNYL